MQRQLIVLDSRYRINPEDQVGSVYKFKLKTNIKLDGIIRLEQFIFQNSQYVFSKENKSNRFIYSDNGNDVIVTLEGKFDTTDMFVKRFNEVMQSKNLTTRMIYKPYLYEFTIANPQGDVFNLKEYYDDGKFLKLLGFGVCEGSNAYTNINVPKLFSQNLIYISLPEIGTYQTITSNSKPFTFIVLTQPGFEIVSNINNTFANEFYTNNKELDELTIRIHVADGLPFVNNKGDANFTIILSY